MSKFEISKKLFAALLLSFMAAATLPACSSSDEAEDSGGSSAGCDDPGMSPSEREDCMQDWDI